MSRLLYNWPPRRSAVTQKNSEFLLRVHIKSPGSRFEPFVVLWCLNNCMHWNWWRALPYLPPSFRQEHQWCKRMALAATVDPVADQRSVPVVACLWACRCCLVPVGRTVLQQTVHRQRSCVHVWVWLLLSGTGRSDSLAADGPQWKSCVYEPDCCCLVPVGRTVYRVCRVFCRKTRVTASNVRTYTVEFAHLQWTVVCNCVQPVSLFQFRSAKPKTKL